MSGNYFPIKLGRRDLQESKQHHPDQTYLVVHLRPLLPSSLPPCLCLFPLTLLPQKQEYPYATCLYLVNILFFPFNVWCHSKGLCANGKMVSIDLSVSPAPLSYCCSLGQTNGVAHCLTMTAAV